VGFFTAFDPHKAVEDCGLWRWGDDSLTIVRAVLDPIKKVHSIRQMR